MSDAAAQAATVGNKGASDGNSGGDGGGAVTKASGSGDNSGNGAGGTGSAAGGDNAGGGSEVTSVIGAAADDKTKTADAKADDKSKADDKPYALTVPKDHEQYVDKAALEKFTAFAKETGITAEQATKVLAFDLERRAAEVKSQDESVGIQSKAWLDQVKQDKELGGAKLATTLASVGRAVTKFGSPELKQELVTLGMDNHPGLVRLLAKVGEVLAEDSGVLEGAGDSRTKKRESIYDQH